MKIKQKTPFFIGITTFTLLILSYFIKIQTDYGANYLTQSRLLSILIFRNPIILLEYILLIIVLIYLGFKKIKIIV